MAKNIVVRLLGWQVRRLRAKNDIRVVAVAGSIGKTSTKFAVSQVLAAKFRVRFQEGNYNDISTVPLVFFGLEQPSLLNPLAWAKTLLKIEAQIRKRYPYDLVVVEVGTDGPGQIEEFSKYLQADIAVLTAITPEHMEYFGTLDAVAKEELAIAGISDALLLNADLCDNHYLKDLTGAYQAFGFSDTADFKLSQDKAGGYTLTKEGGLQLRLSGESNKALIYSMSAAAATAYHLGMTNDEIQSALSTVKAVKGRGMVLNAIEDSKIIDETYNASPDAVKSALDTLYAQQATRKIALLGNMNELGHYSEQAHREVGAYCDPKQLELVVTLGPEANTFLAEAATKAGCRVQRATNPQEAAEYIKEVLTPGSLILAKGSQNNVYAEEAVKALLAKPEDAVHLVRQTAAWQDKKRRNFAPKNNA